MLYDPPEPHNQNYLKEGGVITQHVVEQSTHETDPKQSLRSHDIASGC